MSARYQAASQAGFLRSHVAKPVLAPCSLPGSRDASHQRHRPRRRLLILFLSCTSDLTSGWWRMR